MEEETTTPKIKKISRDLSRLQIDTKARGSHRGFLIQQFQERLNVDRIASGYKPYTIARVGMMLAHLEEWEIDAFYKECKRASIPFGAAFHCGIKPQPSQKK